jgi:two-component system NtrC family sensor kinase
VLVLTGRETREDVARALSAGADDVVGKSRDSALVKARLRALLRRKFLREEDQRLAAEFRRQEIEILKARAEKEAAVARAALAETLEQTNRELEAAYRELSQAQAQLVHSAKMASLGQLVAGIAHEINNPLAFVINHRMTVARALDAVAEEGEALSPQSATKLKKARERLADMDLGLERIKDLVLKLRTFSRLDEGELKYVKLEESIESVITLLQYRLGDRIRLTRQYGGVNIISCYPGPLNQVIMNVLSNAIDAIEGDGEITIRTGREDGMCVIAIADTGRGMPPEVRERIFEPFFTTKPVGAGTGLGLSISYGIVQKHKGTLEVQSEPGNGTEVVIRVPVQPLEGGEADVCPRAAATGGGG